MTDVRATYRIQLHAGFTFDDVAEIAPYLAELGISHVYLSPFLRSRHGSTHGYDVIDHSALDEELGGRAAYERMSAALDEQGLGQILDIVPNHAAVDRSNGAWWDVLTRGRDSRYATFFDIDWNAPNTDLNGKVMVPVLGGPIEEVIAKGELSVGEDSGEPVVRYHEHVFPLAPDTAPRTDGPVDWPGLLAAQHYALCHWRRAARGVNYRRFFDINELIALRVEVPEVFEGTHELALSLIAEGHLDGLRVDHIDGLYDPKGYLEKLRARVGDGAYIVVEKILEPGEELRDDWPVEGTTGYDFLNVATGILVDPAAEPEMTSLYEEFIGVSADLAALEHEKKFLVMRSTMAADLVRLERELERVFEQEGWLESTPLFEDHVRIVLAEVIAAMSVYRTYVSPEGSYEEIDRATLEGALEAARRRTTHLDATVFDRLAQILLHADEGAGRSHFVARFQQATGPIMAKGIEDTLFYNFNRFIALNEVGGDPGHFGVTLSKFHEMGVGAQRSRPRSMLATSTHDTKRSEDVRARLALLSEIPDEWRAAVGRWSDMAERYRTDEAPDRNAEYLLWQTLVGAWPLQADRAVAFMQKAAREAKRYTSWVDPNTGYENALESFVRGVIGDDAIHAEVEAFVRPLVEPGWINSLTQVLIKLTYPGVPDTYQGTELWDLSLVDPDNRRPVDFARRRDLLRQAVEMDGAEVWKRQDEGLPKLFLIAKALRLRAARPDVFDSGTTYTPLTADGAAADHLLGYLRGDALVVVAPLYPLRLRETGWRGTTLALPGGRWRDVLSGTEVQGGRVEIESLLQRFPVALLVR